MPPTPTALPPGVDPDSRRIVGARARIKKASFGYRIEIELVRADGKPRFVVWRHAWTYGRACRKGRRVAARVYERAARAQKRDDDLHVEHVGCAA